MGMSQPDRLPYSPQLTAELAAMEESMDKAIHDAPGGINPDCVVSAMVEQRARELWEAGVMESLADFEACLRDIGSRAYCLALPAYSHEDGPVWSPVSDGTEPKFALAVANGKYSANAMMQEWSMSPRDNANRLAIAGIAKTT